jgi:hypothetical protein
MGRELLGGKKTPRRAEGAATGGVDRLATGNNELTDQLSRYLAQTHRNVTEADLSSGIDIPEEFGRKVAAGARATKQVAVSSVAGAAGMGGARALEALGSTSPVAAGLALLAPVLAATTKNVFEEIKATEKDRLSTALQGFSKEIANDPGAKAKAERTISNMPTSVERRTGSRWWNALKFVGTGQLSFAIPAITRGITQEHIPVETMVRKLKPSVLGAVMRSVGRSVVGTGIGAAGFNVGEEAVQPFSETSQNLMNTYYNGEMPDARNLAEASGRGIENMYQLLKNMYSSIV